MKLWLNEEARRRWRRKPNGERKAAYPINSWRSNIISARGIIDTAAAWP